MLICSTINWIFLFTKLRVDKFLVFLLIFYSLQAMMGYGSDKLMPLDTHAAIR